MFKHSMSMLCNIRRPPTFTFDSITLRDVTIASSVPFGTERTLMVVAISFGPAPVGSETSHGPNSGPLRRVLLATRVVGLIGTSVSRPWAQRAATTSSNLNARWVSPVWATVNTCL